MCAFPLRLKHVRDLCRIGRPLVSLYETPERKSKYLEVWVDRDDETERWIVFRVIERDLLSYLHGMVTLRDLIKSAIDGYVFIKDETTESDRASLLSTEDLPNSLLPSEASTFDPKYDPHPSAGDEQAILLGGSWDMDSLADMSRTYTQVLATARCLGPSAPTTVEGLKGRFDHYRFEGGFTRYHAFANFISALPSVPTTREVQYASPGIMRLGAEPKSVDAARRAIRRFAGNFGAIYDLYQSMHRQLLDLRLMERNDQKPTHEESERLKRSIEALVTAMGVIQIDKLRFVAKTERAAGEIAASYYRKLKKLYDAEEQQRANFL